MNKEDYRLKECANVRCTKIVQDKGKYCSEECLFKSSERGSKKIRINIKEIGASSEYVFEGDTTDIEEIIARMKITIKTRISSN